jgi:hypothetical protein
MEVREVPDGQEFVGKSGTVVITAKSDIVVLRMHGHVSEDLVPGQLALLNRVRTGAPMDFFYDLWELTSYDSPLRVELTNWHLRDRRNLRSLHTVTQSKIVKMGVTVANVALGVITQHKDRRSFEAALERLTASRKSA